MTDSTNATEAKATEVKATEDKAPKGAESAEPDWKAHSKTWETRAQENKTELDALKAQFAALGEALTGKKSGQGADLTAAVANLTTRLEVSELARTHGITDADDIATLQAIPDAEARTRLAARLAPKTDDAKDVTGQQTYPRPKPDASQGPKGNPAAPEPEPGLGRLRAAYAAANKN